MLLTKTLKVLFVHNIFLDCYSSLVIFVICHSFCFSISLYENVKSNVLTEKDPIPIYLFVIKKRNDLRRVTVHVEVGLFIFTVKVLYRRVPEINFYLILCLQ